MTIYLIKESHYDNNGKPIFEGRIIDAYIHKEDAEWFLETKSIAHLYSKIRFDINVYSHGVVTKSDYDGEHYIYIDLLEVKEGS